MRATKPINHTNNPNWRYTPAAATNLQATFRRVRAQQVEQAKRVQPIRKVK